MHRQPSWSAKSFKQELPIPAKRTLEKRMLHNVDHAVLRAHPVAAVAGKEQRSA
jgi:hypothetical protein